MSRLIDTHVHFGRMFREAYPGGVPLTPEQLVDHMDRVGIEWSVLLPLESPEGGWGYLLTEEVVAARDQFPERFIAFCCADPRYPNAPKLVRQAVERWGCVGFGEHVCGLAFDDPLCRDIYAVCNDLALPLVFELNEHYCWDDDGLPRLEQCLRDYPDITWIGHGPGWWAAISADDAGRRGYPTGPILPGGAVDRLMGEYDNLWADISAGSGHNAMTRDPEYTQGFLARHWPKLLFGTDYLAPGQAQPHLAWLAETPMTDAMRYAIGRANACRLLGLADD